MCREREAHRKIWISFCSLLTDDVGDVEAIGEASSGSVSGEVDAVRRRVSASCSGQVVVVAVIDQRVAKNEESPSSLT